MCGSNQKIDLGELLLEWRMNSQISGNNPNKKERACNFTAAMVLF
jgi:hypothetical protein